jgi:hypothetical protein
MIDLVGHTLTAGGKPVARKNKHRNILYTGSYQKFNACYLEIDIRK